MTSTFTSHRLTSSCAVALFAAAALMTGCESGPGARSDASDYQRPARVSAIDMSGVDNEIDQDRMALSRFVGAWDFDGWNDPPGEHRRKATGIAAGVIEHDYHLMLDLTDRVTQGGETEIVVGSMLFAAEPGIGLTLTAWSSNTPVISRFKGRAVGDGSRFIFDEVRTVEGADRYRVDMRFITDDRWTVEFTSSASGHSEKIGSYVFNRAD